MRIIIDIEDENDAFRDECGDLDLATVALNCHEVLRRVVEGRTSGTVRDVNGNSAITYTVER